MEALMTQARTRPRVTARRTRFRRFTVAVAALACAMAASATVVPAAWASNVIPPGGGLAPTPAAYAPGMPGWQITLIAVASALVAAVTAVAVDRARTASRAARPAT